MRLERAYHPLPDAGEIDLLPAMAIILDAHGLAWQKQPDGGWDDHVWVSAGSDIMQPATDISLPAKLLWEP